MLSTKIHIPAEKYGMQLESSREWCRIALPNCEETKKQRLHILKKFLSWVEFFWLQVLVGYTTMLLLRPENLWICIQIRFWVFFPYQKNL